MPKPIDHQQRKQRIVAESVKLFARYGFNEVNFGMIAEAAGVSRTLLYKYFKDKREIFNRAIIGVTSQIRTKYHEVMASAQLADRKLRQMCVTVLALMFENRNFICTIADVLTDCRRRGCVPSDRIEQHTSGLRVVISTILNEGIKLGEYVQSIDVEQTTNVIYSHFEAFALRIAMTGNADLYNAINQVDCTLNSLKIKA